MACYSLHPRSPMDHDNIKQFEREFFLVWKALDALRQSLPGTEQLQQDVARACATLLELMRSADCIDPTVSLNGLNAGRVHSLGS